MNQVLFYGESNGFLTIEKNDKVTLIKEENTYTFQNNYGITIIQNPIFNQCADTIDQLANQTFIIEEVVGDAIVGSLQQ